MPSMQRRQVMAVGVLFFPSLGGCLDRLRGANNREYRTDSLWVENYDSEEYELGLSVSRNEEEVFSTSFIVPEETGFEIPEVGTEEQRCTISTTLNADNDSTFTWTVRDCGHKAGNTDGGITINEGEVQFGTNDCDGVAFDGQRDLQYDDYTEFERD